MLDTDRRIRAFDAGQMCRNGAATCGLLLSAFTLLKHWYDFPDEGVAIVPAFHGLWSGAISGAAVGLSISITLTRRNIHPGIRALAGSMLSLVSCTLLYVAYLIAATPDASSVSHGIALGLDSFYRYVVFVLPGSLFTGAIVGLFCGIVRRRDAAGKRQER